MTPEDIRRLYRQETPATDQEAAEAREAARTDPDEARRQIAVLYALSTEDRAFATLLKLFLEGMLMGLIQQRAESDDAYALACAQLITDLMDATRKRTPRGKPRPAKSA